MPFQSLTHVVYDLAAHPELAIPLREEIEPIIAAEGWTRAALGKMWKLDSLLRESQRFHGIGIGACALVACASNPTHAKMHVPRSICDASGSQGHHIQ